MPLIHREIHLRISYINSTNLSFIQDIEAPYRLIGFKDGTLDFVIYGKELNYAIDFCEKVIEDAGLEEQPYRLNIDEWIIDNGQVCSILECIIV